MQMRCQGVTGINDSNEGDDGTEPAEGSRSTGGGGRRRRRRRKRHTREMAVPSSSSKICFNPKCGASSSERWWKGWRLRSGDVAELCDRCGSAYDELRFCEDFHFDAAGWRNCETCGKRLHCGCIVSAHTFSLLDAGGVECISCAKTSSLNALKPPFWLSPLPSVDGLTDQYTKKWSQAPVPNSGLAQVQQSPGLLQSLAWNSNSCSMVKYPRTEKVGEKLLELEQAFTCFVENQNVFQKEAGGNFKFPAQNETDVGNSEINVRSPLGASVQDNIGGLLDTKHVEGRKSHETESNMIIDELEIKKSLDGQKHESSASCQNVTQHSASLKDNEARDSSKPSGSHAREQRPSMLQQEYPSSFHTGLDFSKEAKTQATMARHRTKGLARNQSILSRYWPRISNQDLQKISGDSSSIITPLFEKTLSASDAGRIGRLVLPKKCAETYFPAISHPEGLPLRIQDANGKDWVFQFRFWPNNNSRMYVLEGVTSCIQSMQLQAGDIVTFSRIDPEGKLLMGFRKASSSVSDQDVQSLEKHTGGEVSSRFDRCKEVVTALPYISSKANIGSANDSSDKRRNRAFGSKNRRPYVDSTLMKVKMTWEEVQEFLQPPPNHVPSIVIIEGHEFEEYEEPPVLGKQTILSANNIGEKTQWVQCKDCSKWRKLPVDAHLPPKWVCSDNVWDPVRSSCSSAQEVPTEQLQGFPSKIAHKETHVSKKLKSGERLTKLDELADLAIFDENESHHPSTHAPTTRHPRHRPGCTCIVCIQPPSGQGPKHEPTCTCNVCLMVKRRFQTLMLRKKKRQSEKEAENAQRNHPSSPEKTEDKVITCLQEVASEKPDDDPSKQSSDLSRNAADNGGLQTCLAYKEKGGGAGKAKIDLNSQPEREEDLCPCSDAVDMAKPFHDFMWMGIGCSSRAQEKQTGTNTVDLVDEKIGETNGDSHELGLQGEVRSPGATLFSKPATTAA
ncbi:B3 domain-containing transcription repressor VAL1-like isoform X2 [Nymphaea colorata]|uniref:B3 domain-containing transcription repressor VAL1-like isoform X2 n=1 Tax=Nymphaea colorata TaxID=210225 RepID=UPI00129D3C7C|nr:B3 domain-containing transcription repressor VAL1-like isoform X2 [Nymphaea colorata]